MNGGVFHGNFLLYTHLIRNALREYAYFSYMLPKKGFFVCDHPCDQYFYSIVLYAISFLLPGHALSGRRGRIPVYFTPAVFIPSARQLQHFYHVLLLDLYDADLYFVCPNFQLFSTVERLCLHPCGTDRAICAYDYPIFQVCHQKIYVYHKDRRPKDEENFALAWNILVLICLPAKLYDAS